MTFETDVEIQESRTTTTTTMRLAGGERERRTGGERSELKVIHEHPRACNNARMYTRTYVTCLSVVCRRECINRSAFIAHVQVARDERIRRMHRGNIALPNINARLSHSGENTSHVFYYFAVNCRKIP